MSFRVAEGYVEVTMDKSKYDADIAKLKGQKLNVDLLARLDDTAARAQLKHLVKDLRVRLTADLDDTQAKAQLAELGGKLTVKVRPEMGDPGVYLKQLERLTRDQQVTITPVMGNPASYLAALEKLTRDQYVDVNPRLRADAYLTQLDRLTRNRNIDIRANLITGDTRARLDTLTRNRRVRVDVDAQGLTGLAGLLSRIGAGAGGASGGIGMLGGRMAALVTAALSALPAIASLGQAIIAMGPAAAIAAPAIGSLISILGALKLGTSGIGDAFKQAFAPAVGGGGAAVDTARKVADAQQQLKIAIRDAADSNRKAIEGVAGAERDLATAQRAERQAQLDLIKARKEAKQQLEDYQQQLIDGELDHRQALLDVQQAKVDLDKTMKDPRATELEKQQAQLAFDQAQQHLAEQTIAQQRLKEQAAEAARAGVDGNEQVARATQDVADAQQDVLDKTQALSEARISADRAAEDGAIRVAQAQQAVADAMQKQAAGGAAVANAMAKLAPAAQEFVRAVIALKPAWDALKLDVQQTLFEGLGERLTTVAHQVLPDLRAGLVGTAGVLNGMAKAALDAIGNLSKAGTLKKAFSSINEGLKPLTAVPGQLLTMFGQLTAAAGPAFQRITTAIAESVGSFGKRLGESFASGRLTETINAALDLVGQFAHLLGDVLGIFGNVMKAAAAAGGDALGTLGAVFSELRNITASPEVQGALTALFTTFNTLAKTVAPLVGQALLALGPVITTLAGPVQTLIVSFGQGLQPIIAALGPVLLAAAQAAGEVVIAASPLLVLAGQLVAQLGPVLVPILTAFGQAFRQAAPYVQQAAQVVGSVLSPILAQLPSVIAPLMSIWLTFNTSLLPVFGELLTKLQPSLMELSQSFVAIMVALAPVLIQFGQFLGTVLPPLLAALTPLINLVAQLAAVLAGELARQVQTVVVPALRMLTQLLSGDGQGALRSFGQVVEGILGTVVREFFLLPGQIMYAIGDLGVTLWNAGSRLIGGLINGIKSKLGELRSYLSDITDMLPDWKGPADKDATILGPSGELLIDGLMGGVDRKLPQLRAQLQGLTGEIGATRFSLGGAGLAPAPIGGLAGAGSTGSGTATLSAPAAPINVTFNVNVTGANLTTQSELQRIANLLAGEMATAIRSYDRGRAR